MPTPLIKLFLLALVGLSAQAANLSGAGSTFAEPLYRKWAEQYQKQAGAGSVVNYEAVGSGEGVKRIATKQVDFGASDEPLKRAELDEKGLRQFPCRHGGGGAGGQSARRAGRLAQAQCRCVGQNLYRSDQALE